MACNPDFVQYVVDQCADAGEISARKMFGDYGIYCHGKIFGLICDDRLYIKPTEAGRRLLRREDLQAAVRRGERLFLHRRGRRQPIPYLARGGNLQ